MDVNEKDNTRLKKKHCKIHHFGTGYFQNQEVSSIDVFQTFLTKTANDTLRRDLWRFKEEESEQKYYLPSEW